MNAYQKQAERVAALQAEVDALQLTLGFVAPVDSKDSILEIHQREWGLREDSFETYQISASV